MARFYHTLIICAVLVASVGCSKKQAPAAPQKQAAATKQEPALGLMTVVPDNVLAFVASAGCDNLKPAFEKSILGRIWNDPEVQSLYQTATKQLLTLAKKQMPDANEAQVPEMVLNFAELALAGPAILGAASKQTDEGPPVYGFVIIDAGAHKAEIAARLSKLEGLAREGDIKEVEIGSFKMHGPADNRGVPGYWGWVDNYLVAAVNDGEGLAIKHIRQPHAKAPDYLKVLPTANDVLTTYVDCQKVGDVVKTVADQQSASDKFAVVSTVIEKLGLKNVGTITSGMRFDGPDMVFTEFIEAPAPRTGLFASYKAIDLKMFDMVDPRAVRAGAVNCDVGGMYDTIMTAIKAAAPANVSAEIDQKIADVQSQVQVDIRKDLLGAFAGPLVWYSVPGGVVIEAPGGGVVVIAELKDGPLLEKTLDSLGKFAAAVGQGVVQVSSQAQPDGRTLRTWVIAPLAMVQVMPCWMVVDNRIFIASNPAMHKLALAQMASPKAAAQSIRSTEGYKTVAAKLPKNLLFLSYTDSKVQFKQMMLALQGFWPMITMFAAKAQITLPAMLPSLSGVAEDMGPSCQYSWFDDKGLHSRYHGSGIELSLGSVAGVSLGAGVMMPALARARSQGRRAASGAHLKQIGMGCLMYANDNDGNLPPSIATLAEKPYLSGAVLESPSRPKDFEGPSYIYVDRQTTAMGVGNIVAYENPAFLTDGTNVLFLDCHVEWMKPEAFLRKLEATYKRLGREMPQIKFKGSKQPVPVEETKPVPAPLQK